MAVVVVVVVLHQVTPEAPAGNAAADGGATGKGKGDTTHGALFCGWGSIADYCYWSATPPLAACDRGPALCESK